MSQEENLLDAALLRTMTLLSTLNLAAELAFGMRERKAGRDPSAENDASVVQPELAEISTTLRTLAFQLESSTILTSPEEADATQSQAFTVQRYVDLMRLQKVGQLLHRLHQHLLSLYPTIDEVMAEEARLLENACNTTRNASTNQFAAHLLPFLQRLKAFLRLLPATE